MKLVWVDSWKLSFYGNHLLQLMFICPKWRGHNVIELLSLTTNPWLKWSSVNINTGFINHSLTQVLICVMLVAKSWFFLSMKDNYWTKSFPVYKLVIIILFEVIESYTLFKPKTINLILFILKVDPNRYLFSDGWNQEVIYNF